MKILTYKTNKFIINQSNLVENVYFWQTTSRVDVCEMLKIDYICGVAKDVSNGHIV